MKTVENKINFFFSLDQVKLPFVALDYCQWNELQQTKKQD